MSWRTLGPTLLLGIASAACGSVAPPTEARTETVAAIRVARELGATEAPRAAYHLELAEEQLTIADALVRRGHMDRAARTLSRAEADAELAIAIAREAAVQAEAEDVRARIRELRERHL